MCAKPEAFSAGRSSRQPGRSAGIELPRAALALAGGALGHATSETDSEIGKSAALVRCSIDGAGGEIRLDA